MRTREDVTRPTAGPCRESTGTITARILEALEKATAQTKRPNLIVTRTHIANGAPTKHDTAEAHGAPLGAEEVAATKKALAWTAESFAVPEEVRGFFARRAAENRKLHDAWKRGFEQWSRQHPDLAKLWKAQMEKALPSDLEAKLLAAVPEKPDASRNLGGAVLQKAAALVPGLVGGSADLEPSTKTLIKESSSIRAGEFQGRNIHFGIREHAMGGS